MDAAFDQIRQYGRDSVSVTVRLLEALEFIAQQVRHEEDRQIVKLHAEMISRIAGSQRENHDKHAIRERYERVLERLQEVASATESAASPNPQQVAKCE